MRSLGHNPTVEELEVKKFSLIANKRKKGEDFHCNFRLKLVTIENFC